MSDITKQSLTELVENIKNKKHLFTIMGVKILDKI